MRLYDASYDPPRKRGRHGSADRGDARGGVNDLEEFHRAADFAHAHSTPGNMT
jgi:hypothetical protein